MHRPLLALLLVALPGCYLSHGIDAPPDPRVDGGPPDVHRDGGPPELPRDGGPPPIEPDAFVVPCMPLPPPPPPSDRVGLLAWQRAAILGTWRGIRTTPWDGPTAITITFRTDGTYRASCDPERDDCAPLYWGDTLIDGPFARYELFDVTASGTGEGRISPLWFGSPSWEGDLEGIAFDPLATHLTMRFFDADGRGPVEMILDRACD